MQDSDKVLLLQVGLGVGQIQRRLAKAKLLTEARRVANTGTVAEKVSMFEKVAAFWQYQKEAKMANWKKIAERAVSLTFTCDCGYEVPVGPEAVASNGAPMCCDCDEEMTLSDIEVDLDAI